MTKLKTVVNDKSVIDFVNSVENSQRKADALILLEIFKKITKYEPKLWGSSIVGYGQYHYKSERSSQEGDWPLVAFSPRKLSLSIYIMPGFDKYSEILSRLGKHKKSVGCLYLNKLSDVKQSVLEELIQKSFIEMKKQHGIK